MKRMDLIKQVGFSKDLTASTMKTLIAKETAVAEYVIDKVFSCGFYGIYASETQFTINSEKAPTKKEIDQIKKVVKLEYVDAHKLMKENDLLIKFCSVTFSEEMEEEELVFEKEDETEEAVEILLAAKEEGTVEEDSEAPSVYVTGTGLVKSFDEGLLALERFFTESPDGFTEVFVEILTYKLEDFEKLLPKSVEPSKIYLTKTVMLGSSARNQDFKEAKKLLQVAFDYKQKAP